MPLQCASFEDSYVGANVLDIYVVVDVVLFVSGVVSIDAYVYGSVVFVVSNVVFVVSGAVSGVASIFADAYGSVVL